MWLKYFFFFVGLACASHNPGWKHDHEYIYQIRGRTLTSLDQIDSKYTGILLKGQLRIRPTSDGHLSAKIENLQYANIHSKLYESWRQYIPDSELSYQELPLSSKPFKVLMNNGAVEDLLVDQTVSNWEANMIKGVVSQLQLDTDAENQIRSSINIFAQEGDNNAVFKTLEKSVTGECETLYEIHPYPEYVLQTKPWLAPLKQLRENKPLIEVVKNKNFTRSRDLPSYHFGFQGVGDFDVDNKIEDVLARSSVSHAILSGDLKSFTLQSSWTEDQVTVHPNMQDKQRGSTKTLVNLTLSSMEQQQQEFPVSNVISVGLVYRYDQPFSESNKLSRQINSMTSSESSESSESQESWKTRSKRNIAAQWSSSESSGYQNPEEYLRVQNKPQMKEAPASPLLPLTVGFNGQAISKKQNIQEDALTLAKKIGQEYQDPQHIPRQNTLGKFLLLSSLVKVMNYEQMKHVADQLYVEEKEDASASAWYAYRDAVAQAGTGPALLCIEQWIRDRKIVENEAAQIVATAASAARQPTEEYMKVFYRLVQDRELMSQKYLNESLLLSYTTLVRQVYVDQPTSHNKYPVHSFGTFNTEQGCLWVEKELIPYLSSKLQEAISRSETSRIHVYIRALGNLGHKKVLAVFKPYLEGERKASQFQRVLMVMALDELINTHPKVARSVLYRIYQNTKDFDQVRVAAVYQLIRTDPTPAMLQKMAMYTKIDTSNQVNSAVKSVIENAARVKGPRFEKLRVAAESARPYLTSETFGTQNSKFFLLNHVAEEMKMDVKQILQSFGSDDSVLPKGFNYWLRQRLGGIKQHVITMQSMVSSIEDLINVFEQQTKIYRKLVQEKQSHQSVNTKWSSEHTAKVMNVQNEQREQLEGYLYLYVNSLQKLWSFDNQTVENLPEVLRKLEEELQNGIHHHYNKMVVHPEYALSFPTAWGLPFIYTFDTPMFVKIESDIKAVAKPTISTGESIQAPETIDIEYKINGFVSARSQSQFGVFTPFNSKRYSAGYDKNFQVVVPKLSGKIHVNVEEKQITLESASLEKKDVNLLHFSTWPYTSQNDIYSLKQKTETIQKEKHQRLHTIIGEKNTGIALSLELRSDKKIDYTYWFNRLHQKDIVSVLLAPWLDDEMCHVEINVGIDSSKTSTRKVVLHFGHQQKYSSGLQNTDSTSSKISHPYRVFEESWGRQREFLQKCSNGISNFNAQVVDAVILFEGNTLKKHSATFAAASSNVDPKSRILMQSECHMQQGNPLKISLSLDNKIPNPPALSLKSALEFDPTSLFEIKGAFEKHQQSSSIRATVQLAKSEQRKQYIKQHPLYKKCQEQVRQGNQQLPECEMLTAQANLLDQAFVRINYENVDPRILNETYKIYSLVREHLYSYVSEDIIMEQLQSENKQIEIDTQYSPELSRVNVSIRSDFGRSEINNVPVNDFARNLLVSHPVYSAHKRLQGYLLNYPSFESSCVLDHKAVNTLDNKTYPVILENDWVVLLHYVPRRPSPVRDQIDMTVPEQLNQHLEGYIVYARAHSNDNSRKEIKIVLQSPNSLGKVIDITLKPSSDSGYPKLYVQNEEIKYDSQETHIYDNYMQVFKLPNKELKVVVHNVFNVVFDSVRAKIVLVNDKFRDASRGLCGTFTGEEETDFTHPGNCIIQSPDVFVATNTVPEKQRTKRMNDMMMIQAEEKKCYQKTIGYAKIVSAEDTESARMSLKHLERISLKTRYVVMNDQICFSVEPLPVCKPGYRQRNISKIVPAHCVKATLMTDQLRQQIDQGASPDFTMKTPNKEVMMTVAKNCEN